MKNVLFSQKVNWIVRLVLGGVFIYAGVTKGMHMDGFAATIDGYGLTTWRVSKLLAMTLPVVELLSGLGLILNIRGALALVVVQLLGFMGVIAYAIHLGLDVDCGCFGPSDPGHAEAGNLMQTLVRDALMFTACLFIYWQRKPSGLTPRPLVSLFKRNAR